MNYDAPLPSPLNLGDKTTRLIVRLGTEHTDKDEVLLRSQLADRFSHADIQVERHDFPLTVILTNWWDLYDPATEEAMGVQGAQDAMVKAEVRELLDG